MSLVPISEDKYQMMLKKLDSIYIRETEIKQEMHKLKVEYQQLLEDKELLQTMIMHQANKDYRKKKFGVL